MYRLIGNNNLFNPIEQVLENNNIPKEDIYWYQNPAPFEHDGILIKNMAEGVDLLLSHISKKNHIHVQVDLDLDGFTSSAILINYLKRVYPDINLTWSNHTKEMKHGIELDLVPESTNLLIVPDAGSNSYEEHKILREKGIDVLIADHHECEEPSEDALTINIQLDNYPNKQLCGAAVTLKLIQQIDKTLGLNYSEDYYDLCAFGLVGDSMLLNNKENFWIVKKGLENIKNEFLMEIIKENVDKGSSLTPTALAFKCNPKINSCIRVGTEQELDDLMKAFLEHQEVTINNRLRKADKSETWTRKMARTCNNTYARQRKLRDKIMEEIEEKIERDNLNDNRFIVVDVEGEYDSNMSGYVAIALVGKYSKPVIVLRQNEEDLLTGSLRGYDPLLADTKKFLKGLELFEEAEGHAQACGLKIKKTNFSQLDKKINKELDNYEHDNMCEVDFELNIKSMTSSFIKDMEKQSHLWCRGIEAPKYAIKNVELDAARIQLIGKTQNVVKFSNGAVEYVQFSGSEDIKQYVGQDKLIVCTLIGTTGVNSWRGESTPQFVIDKIVVHEIRESPAFGFTF